MMRYFSIKSQISFAQAMMLASVLLLAAVLEIVPNRNQSIVLGRAQLCEMLAISTASFVQRKDESGLKYMLEMVQRRNPEIQSIGVRRQDGTLRWEMGEHDNSWLADAESAPLGSQMSVRIHTGSQEWGQLEVRFTPLAAPGWAGVVQDPIVQLVLFVAGCCFIVNYFYFARKLQDLDPTRAVPDRVRSALNTLTEGLLVVDKQERIVLINEAMANSLGRPIEQLVGAKANRLPWTMNADEPDPSFPWTRALRDQERQTGTIMGLESPHGPRTLMVHACPVLGPSGDLHGVLTSFEDITELEEAKVELKKSKDAADAANRAKSEFLAHMSHEIRTPMNAILGFTDVMRRGLVFNAPQRQEYLNTIHASGEHLLNLINDILDLSKIESGRLELEISPCSPHQLLWEVVSVMRGRAESKGIQLNFRSVGGLPERIQTDGTRLRQLVTNLVGNAIKFTSQGSVTVVARIAKTPGGPQLAIDVVDTGIGMTEAQAGRIFQAFVQADASVTRRFGGTGLGLTISKRFAEALGGTITVTSEPGRGSCFTATVDTGDLDGVRMLTDEEASEPVRERVPTGLEVRLPPARILVADDVEANRKLLQVLLESAGATVITAGDGSQARDRALRGGIDIVLMDMQMPILDGFAATRALREAGFTAPIIALTADAMMGSEQRCREAGCSGFLTKPIQTDLLLAAVAQATKEIAGLSAQSPQNSLEKSIPEVASKPTDEECVDIDREALDAIRRDYLPVLRADVAALRPALEASDWERLATIAHSIKGSAGTFGLHEFTEPARMLQDAAQQHDDELSIDVLVGELTVLADQLEDDFPKTPLPQSRER